MSADSNDMPGAKPKPETNEQKLIAQMKMVYGLEVFCDQMNRIYISINIKGVARVVRLDSEEAAALLRYALTLGIKSKTVSKKLTKRIIDELYCNMVVENFKPQRQVYIRVGQHADKIYLNLANEQRQVVEISASGWEIVTNPPVLFENPAGQCPLPTPTKGGSLIDLAKVLPSGVTSGQLQSIIAAVLSWMNPSPNMAYPILAFEGPAGSGKSVTSRIVQSLIDPQDKFESGLTLSDTNVALAASNSYVLQYGNLTTISERDSRMLCLLSTGGTHRERKLYSQTDELVVHLHNPVILNGISGYMTKADLLDRVTLISLPLLSERKPQSELNELFAQLHPAILGAFCDAVSAGLRPSSNPIDESFRTHRLADASIFAARCLEGVGMQTDDLKRALSKAKDIAAQAALEALPFAGYLAAIADKGQSVTAQELLNDLNKRAKASKDHYDPEWPKNAAQLGKMLATAETALRNHGIAIERQKGRGDGRKMRIYRIA